MWFPSSNLIQILTDLLPTEDLGCDLELNNRVYYTPLKLCMNIAGIMSNKAIHQYWK
jgi:hypothetical protein